jgi:hypothetical protein
LYQRKPTLVLRKRTMTRVLKRSHDHVHVNGHDLLRLSRDCGAPFPAEGRCSRQNFLQENHE